MKAPLPLPELKNSVREQFEDRLIQVLMIASIVTVIVGFIVAEGDQYLTCWIPGASMAAVTFFIIVITAVNDYMKDKQF